MDVVVSGQVKKLERKVEDLLTQLGRITTMKQVTDVINPGQEASLDLSIGPDLNKYMIKYVYVEGLENSKMDIEILTSTADHPFLVYKNKTNGHILYDVLDLPYEDEDAAGALHLKIMNSGSIPSSFTIRVSGLVSN